MCDLTEVEYLDGEVVWVKLGSCWWPGQVVAIDKLPPDVLPSFRKPPIAIVKFFQEDTYEYVKNLNSIYKYNCSRKHEFITKGLYMYRNKNRQHMDKFPEDIVNAEKATDGDIDILTREEFQEEKKESYAGLFGEVKKTPISSKKGRGRPGRTSEIVNTTPMRSIRRATLDKTDYKVHILVQASNQSPRLSTECASPSTVTHQDTENIEEKSTVNTENALNEDVHTTPISTPTSAKASGILSCHACPFTTTRLNVMILHNKTHSSTYSPYIPSPVRKKVVKKALVKSISNSSKLQKTRRPRKEKLEKPIKKPKNILKRTNDDETNANCENKKLKTDEQIKSSLLADWDDIDDEDESNDVSCAAPSCSSDTTDNLVISSADQSSDITSPIKKVDELNERPGSSRDAKYDFCEDEPWPVEKDGGRKIPRVKNPSKRKEDTKSVSLDEEDVAKEVAELLNKTTVPELPSAPEPLKVEENFPEPPVVKSPDKNSNPVEDINKIPDNNAVETQPTKAIFKTKTFFRSRHSRSQDAIGKYVAEQLNAAERMDISECDLNGSDTVSSPEARDSPPVEPVKVARLAPKIQLKKMKAEAAQLLEKEKLKGEDIANSTVCSSKSVLYPTQEIKPINRELQDDNKVADCNIIETDLKNIEESANITENIIDYNSKSEVSVLTNTAADIDIKTYEPYMIESSTSDIPDNKGNKPYEPYMNESTASAVDALLSVSREADRVTKIISNDLPEDLFEDDNKESGIGNSLNGINELEEISQDKENSTEHNVIENNFNDKIQLESEFEKDVIEEVIEGNSVKDPCESSKVTLEDVNTNVPSEINEEEHTTDTIVSSEAVSDQELQIAETVSESDLQIAETLINLPSTAIKTTTSKNQDSDLVVNSNFGSYEEKLAVETVNTEEIGKNEITESQEKSSNNILVTSNENLNTRFETEEEKSENLNAAQSLVEMSESVEHKLNVESVSEIPTSSDFESINNNNSSINAVQLNVEVANDGNNTNGVVSNSISPKILKVLEEPAAAKTTVNKISNTPTKPTTSQGKEKILNFDGGKQVLKPKPQSPKQKIIIRRSAPSKNIINLNDVTPAGTNMISRTNKQHLESVQTYTIQASPNTPTDANTIIIQPKIRKLTQTSAKIPKKLKPQTSLVVPVTDIGKVVQTVNDNSMFDINSMPIVLSDDILTPENIDKMPIVMSDGNIITNPVSTTTIISPNSPRISKTKQHIFHADKVALSPKTKSDTKQQTLLMNSVAEVKGTTPNILSKSSKGGPKSMLVIDKTTGIQKIIMTKSDTAIKEIKQTPTKLQPVPQSGKTEKFIILPSTSSPRPTRTQKIVINPQTGKARVLATKGPELATSTTDNKPVAAKLIQAQSDNNTPGNTVMIITNAQGAQSRIVLTPEHEKILFPNKQQPNITQLKTVAHTPQRIAPNAGIVQKSLVTSVTSTKTPSKIVQKQNSAIITSKGQLIVGGRVATTVQNIAPMPDHRSAEFRTVPKRIIASEPKKLVQTIQRNSSEPLIFLQQKSGTVMQLTKEQYEHLQRTGQIVQKSPGQEISKIVSQKTMTLPAKQTTIAGQKQIRKVKKTTTEMAIPPKKVKQESLIQMIPTPAAPAPQPALAAESAAPLPRLAPLSQTSASATYDMDHLDELIPSTAIARQEPPPLVAAEPEPLADAQLLAVPGENFGGPPGTFYLCFKDNGTLTPIDNRPLVLENNQLVPMVAEPPPERRDILEAALANSDVFHAEAAYREPPLAPSVVSETSTTLHQPIMTPVEVPSKLDGEPALAANLEDGLAVIGVTPHVPTTLELPITVTDPRIAPRVAPQGLAALTGADSVGKSMPLLTDDDALRLALPDLAPVAST